MDANKVSLVTNAMQGDQKAITSLCELKARSVLFVCTRLTGNPSDGEDAAQEVLVKVFQNIRYLKRAEAFEVWLSRIISTTCSDMRRDTFRQKGELPLEAVMDIFLEERGEFLPQQYAEIKEKRAAVMQAFDLLPFNQRQLLMMFYYEDLSIREMAQVLRISENAVQKQLGRARQRLKRQLERDESGGEVSALSAVAATGTVPTLTRIFHDVQAESEAEEAVQRLLSRLGKAPAPALASRIAKVAIPVLSVAGATVLLAVFLQYKTPPSDGGAPAEAFVPQQESSMAAPPSEEGVISATDRHSDGGNAPKPDDSIAGGGGETVSSDISSSGSSFEDARSESGFAAAEPSAPAPTVLPPADEGTFSLNGDIVLKNKDGAVISGGKQFTNGLTVELWQASTLLGRAVTNTAGSYSFQLNPMAEGTELTLRLGKNPMFTSMDEEIKFAFARGEAQLPALAVTDGTEPTGSIAFLDEDGAVLKSSVANPAFADLTVRDATKVQVAWQVLADGNGETVLKGEGEKAALDGLVTVAGPGRYTITFYMTDAAENTAQIQRIFVVLE